MIIKKKITLSAGLLAINALQTANADVNNPVIKLDENKKTTVNQAGKSLSEGHMATSSGWSNDLQTIVKNDDGSYDLYYLHSSDGATNPFGQHGQNWEHRRTTDFKTFSVANNAIESHGGDENDGWKSAWTGTVTKSDGSIAETSNGQKIAYFSGLSKKDGRQNIWVAASTDNGMTYTKVLNNGKPVVTVDNAENKADERDPYVFKWGNQWLMYTAEGRDIGVYKSSDGINWTKADPNGESKIKSYTFFQGRSFENNEPVECPALKTMKTPDGQIKQVLFFGAKDAAHGDTTGTYYIVGHLDNNGLFAAEQGVQRLDQGSDYYGANFESGDEIKDSVLSMAWAGNWNYTASGIHLGQNGTENYATDLGSYTSPRKLTLDNSLKIRQQIAFAPASKSSKDYNNLSSANPSSDNNHKYILDDDTKHNAYVYLDHKNQAVSQTIKLKFHAKDGNYKGHIFLQLWQGSDYVKFEFDPENGKYNVKTYAAELNKNMTGQGASSYYYDGLLGSGNGYDKDSGYRNLQNGEITVYTDKATVEFAFPNGQIYTLSRFSQSELQDVKIYSQDPDNKNILDVTLQDNQANSEVPYTTTWPFENTKSVSHDKQVLAQSHLTTSNYWSNDLQTISYNENGYYDLYYSHTDKSNNNPDRGADWEHRITKDFKTFTEANTAIAKTGGDNSDGWKSVWTGSVIVSDGQISGTHKGQKVTYFSGLSKKDGRQTIWAVASVDNGMTYTQVLNNGHPILTADNAANKTDERDPYVFTFNGHYLMYTSEGDELGVYKSNDGINWTKADENGASKVKNETFFNGRSFAGNAPVECPVVKKMKTSSGQEKIVLFFGAKDGASKETTGTYYIVGRLDDNGLFVPDTDVKRLDQGSDYYGANFSGDDNVNDSILTMGWIGNWNYINSGVHSGQDGKSPYVTDLGSYSLPRKLALNDDLTLTQTIAAAPDNIATYQYNDVNHDHPITNDGRGYILGDDTNGHMYAYYDLAQKSANQTVKLHFKSSTDKYHGRIYINIWQGEDYIQFNYDPSNGFYCVRSYASELDNNDSGQAASDYYRNGLLGNGNGYLMQSGYMDMKDGYLTIYTDKTSVEFVFPNGQIYTVARFSTSNFQDFKIYGEDPDNANTMDILVHDNKPIVEACLPKAKTDLAVEPGTEINASDVLVNSDKFNPETIKWKVKPDTTKSGKTTGIVTVETGNQLQIDVPLTIDVKAAQKVIKVIFTDDNTGKQVGQSKIYQGRVGEVVKFDPAIPNGYKLVNGQMPQEQAIKDDQVITVHLAHKITTLAAGQHGISNSDLQRRISRTITINIPNKMPQTIAQVANFTRNASYDEVTGAINYGNWTSDHTKFDKVNIPTVAGYTPSQTEIAEAIVTSGSTFDPINVTYTANNTKAKVNLVDKTGQVMRTLTVTGKTAQKGIVTNWTVPDGWQLSVGQNLPKVIDMNDDSSDKVLPNITIEHIIQNASAGEHGISENDLRQTRKRTIVIINPQGGRNVITQAAIFTRTASYDNVTGEIKYGNWTSDESKYDAVSIPAIPGYISNLQIIPEQNVSVADKDQTVNIIYDKLPTASVSLNLIENGQIVKTLTVSGFIGQKNVLTKWQAPEGYKIISGTIPSQVDIENEPKVLANVTVEEVKQVIKAGQYGVNASDTTATAKRNIKIIMPSGEIKAIIQSITMTRNAIYNAATKTVSYDNWTSNKMKFDAVNVPQIAGYTPSQEVIPEITVNDPVTKDIMITYTKNNVKSADTGHNVKLTDADRHQLHINKLTIYTDTLTEVQTQELSMLIKNSSTTIRRVNVSMHGDALISFNDGSSKVITADQLIIKKQAEVLPVVHGKVQSQPTILEKPKGQQIISAPTTFSGPVPILFDRINKIDELSLKLMKLAAKIKNK